MRTVFIYRPYFKGLSPTLLCNFYRFIKNGSFNQRFPDILLDIPFLSRNQIQRHIVRKHLSCLSIYGSANINRILYQLTDKSTMPKQFLFPFPFPIFPDFMAFLWCPYP